MEAKEKIQRVIDLYGIQAVVSVTVEGRYFTNIEQVMEALAEGDKVQVLFNTQFWEIESFGVDLYARTERMYTYLGWSQKELADKTGYSYAALKNALSKMRKGKVFAVFQGMCSVFESMYKMGFRYMV